LEIVYHIDTYAQGPSNNAREYKFQDMTPPRLHMGPKPDPVETSANTTKM